VAYGSRTIRTMAAAAGDFSGVEKLGAGGMGRGLQGRGPIAENSHTRLFRLSEARALHR
jgi:hypothetical protein